MADEGQGGGFRKFPALLKARPKGLFGHKFQNVRGRGLYNRHQSRGQSRGAVFYGQKIVEETSGSNNVAYREGWFHGNTNGFYPASGPPHQNKDSNSIGALPYNQNNRFEKIHRGHSFGFGVHDDGCDQQNLQNFKDKLHGHERGRNYFRGHGRGGHHGNHTHGRGYHDGGVSNFKDAKSFNFHREGWDLQPISSKQISNKVFIRNHGKRGGRGDCLRGIYKRFGIGSGISKAFQSMDNKVNVSDSLHVDADPIEQIECKNEGKVCIIRSSLATNNYGSIGKESESQVACPLQHSASNSCSLSSVLQKSESHKEGVPAQIDNLISLNDERHHERAFISCGGGTTKRRRSSAVRDFPERSGRLHVSPVKKIIIKRKGRKSVFSRDLRLEDSGHGGSECDCTVTKEISSLPIKIVVPADCHNAGPELVIKDGEKPQLEMVDGTLDLVRCDLETSCEMRTECSPEKIIAPPDCSNVGPELAIEDCDQPSCEMVDGSLDIVRSDLITSCEMARGEVNCSAKHTESSPEMVIENCSSLILSKRNSWNEQVSETREFENKSKTFLSGKGDNFGITEAELSVQILDTQISEIASKSVEGDGNSFVKCTEASPEKIAQNCGSLTLLKGSCGNKQVLETTEVETFLGKGAGLEDAFRIIEADVPKLSLQIKDPQDFESSPQNPTHRKIAEVSGTTTGLSVQISPQSIEHLQRKVRKQKRRTDVQDAHNLPQSKFQPNIKVCAAPPDGSHSHCGVTKKLKVQDSMELLEEKGALIPYQSNDGGNRRNKCLKAKGSSKAKLFQSSKSFDPNNAAKLLTLEANEGVSDRALVKRTLHEFESIRKAMVKSQMAVKRADLDAGTLLRKKGMWRNCDEKIVGEVPGVEVGDQFSFRMEMLMIGLHRQIQSGIDFIPGKQRLNRSPLATSIVASGGYEDDKDDGNTLIYSGQGGSNINKKQESNQELVRGNLALSNSMKEKTPVRVIKGTIDLASPSSKVYTYDGLYDVVNYAFERGAAGFCVYQFTLTRRPGQPQVGLSFLSNLKKKGLSRPNLLLDDISRGQERLPVCVVNEVDEDPAPLHCSYIPSMKYPLWYSPLLPQGCQCIGGCDEERCSCAIKNGGEFPYNEKGYLLRDKKVLYECGPSCSCSSSCQNRVTQKGLRYRLEIFKTENRGWGVRSLDSIQPGGFICEYTGELLSDAEAEQRVGNDEYLFVLGNDCNPSAAQSDAVDANSSLAVATVPADVEYTIDAKDLGNVARFINHSCSPNLYPQNVLYDSDDLRFPHVMLIAMEHIPPMRELTYDYNYSLDQVQDAYGNVKTKACYCGAQDCQGRLY